MQAGSDAALTPTLAQVSFVNSICTIKGGTHVNYIVDQITKWAAPSRTCLHRVPSINYTYSPAPGPLQSANGAVLCRSLSETLTKKNKNSNVKAFMVKNYLSVFINAMIENPAFDSQVPPR